MAESDLIRRNIERVTTEIDAACLATKRPAGSVRLLAVSKTKPVAAVSAAYQAGLREFGENYVQEGVEKIETLSGCSDIVWHLIGPLQSNKTRIVAEHFDWVQSIDRLKIARRLNEQRPDAMGELQVLIQINIDDEDSKAGISLTALPEVAAEISQLSRLNLRGIMAIPAASAAKSQQQQSFFALANAYRQLRQQYPQVDTLSLGMSGDLATAIHHGSTMVRVGSSIFGKR